MKKLSSFITITALFTMLSGQAYALNPQPEVPSKARPNEHTNPNELNPQPEVPSLSNIKHEGVNFKALHSQPGTPPKKNKVKKSKHTREKHIRETR
jgi:hypothetical protein